MPGQRGPVGFTRAFYDVARSERITLRDLARRSEGGHRLVIGTPDDVAADLLEWWDSGVVDGFTLQLPVLPDDLRLFVDEVVPRLVRAAPGSITIPGGPCASDSICRWRRTRPSSPEDMSRLRCSGGVADVGRQHPRYQPATQYFPLQPNGNNDHRPSGG